MVDITGTEANETLTGTSGDDVIITGGGTDRVNAGGGDDRIITSAGNILLLDGGAGYDTLVVTDSVTLLIEGIYDQPYQIEAIEVASATATVRLDAYHKNIDLSGVTVSGGSLTFLTGRFPASYQLTGSSDHFIGLLVDETEPETVRAGAGDDVIEGQWGQYYGEAGNDTLSVVWGDRYNWSSVLDGGAGDDLLLIRSTRSFNGYGTIARGGAGDDRIVAQGTQLGVVDGGAGIDTFVMADNDLTVSASRSYYPDPAADGSAQGYLWGVTFRDVERFEVSPNGGTLKVNVPFYPSGIAAIDLSSVTTVSGGGRIKILGDSQGDAIKGSNSTAVGDLINGAAGDDIITGGLGDDEIDGGAGYDIAEFFGSRSAYQTSSVDGAIIVEGPDGRDTLRGIEALRFSDGVILITPAYYAGNETGETLIGSYGDDEIRGFGGDDVIEGLGGSDELVGGDGNDIVRGGDGDDEVRGGLGDDHLDGGAGNDVLSFEGATGGVYVNFRAGTATGQGNDTFVNIERVNGTAFADVITGREEDNWFDGGGGIGDVLYGGMGNDILEVNYVAPSGPDTGAYLSQLYGEEGNDILMGSVGRDVLWGGLGDDFIMSRGGNDIIDGGDGTDRILLWGEPRDFVFETTPDGAQTVRHILEGWTASIASIELVQFKENTPVTLAEAKRASFDPYWYIAGRPDLIAAYANDPAGAYAHYLAFAEPQGLPATNFDTLRYIASNPDLIARFGTNPAGVAEHYVREGVPAGRSATAFNGELYLASNRDLALSMGLNPEAATLHYITTGHAQGRPTASFDAYRYIASNPDLIVNIGDDPAAAVRHYVRWGAAEGRPTTTFDARLYIASHDDLVRAYHDDTAGATRHWILYGAAQGRASSGFDVVAYILSHPELAGLTQAQALDHWLASDATNGGDRAFSRDQGPNGHGFASSPGGVLNAFGEVGRGEDNNDWFQTSFTQGQTVRIDLRGAGGGYSLPDGRVSIYDALGNLLFTDDDSGPGSDASLVFTAPRTSLYYIVVTSADGTTGEYNLNIQPAPAAAADNTPTDEATPLVLPGLVDDPVGKDGFVDVDGPWILPPGEDDAVQDVHVSWGQTAWALDLWRPGRQPDALDDFGPGHGLYHDVWMN